MELESLETGDGYEIVAITVGGKSIIQAVVVADGDDFTITNLFIDNTDGIRDAILNEYVENPPS